MSRKKVESPIDSPNARRHLAARKAPYWRMLDAGCYLGYRKGSTGGRWLARVYDAGRGGYDEQRVGVADDAIAANGSTILSFSQAMEAVRQAGLAAGRTVHAAASAAMTVDEAFGHYLAFVAVHRRSIKRLRGVYQTHVAPRFGTRAVVSLTTPEIADWHQGLVTAPRLCKPKGGAAIERPVDLDDPEAMRKRKVSANVILKCFRAALNHVVDMRGVPAAKSVWAGAKLFRNVDHPRLRWLEGAEVLKLFEAAADDPMIDIIDAGLATGLRWEEIANRKVGDFSHNERTLLLGRTKAGKPRYARLSPDALEVFRRLCEGRARDEVIFAGRLEVGFRPGDARDWRAHSAQTRPFRRLAEAAGFAVTGPDKVTFHTLRHTFASHMIMNGATLKAVALALGHADTRMVDRTYGHLAASFVEKQVASFAPSRRRFLAAADNVADLEHERARRQARAS